MFVGCLFGVVDCDVEVVFVVEGDLYFVEGDFVGCCVVIVCVNLGFFGEECCVCE